MPPSGRSGGGAPKKYTPKPAQPRRKYARKPGIVTRTEYAPAPPAGPTGPGPRVADRVLLQQVRQRAARDLHSQVGLTSPKKGPLGPMGVVTPRSMSLLSDRPPPDALDADGRLTPYARRLYEAYVRDGWVGVLMVFNSVAPPFLQKGIPT